MRSRRLMLAATALLAVTSLAGCSGDDSDGALADEPTSPTLSGPPESADDSFHRTCQVEVTLSGSAEASWKGEGASTNQAGPTMYHSEDGKNRITVYAGKDDLPTNANITVEGATYTTTSDEGLDVAGNGTEASVDADTVGVDGSGPHVMATFDCGKDAKGKS